MLIKVYQSFVRKPTSFIGGMNDGRLKSLKILGSFGMFQYEPNKQKVLALNRTLSEYFRLVRWYLCFNSKSKSILHENCYEKAKGRLNLNTALIQTTRDKAVEILKGFEETRKENSV
jgi:hypothetical protein